MLALLCRSALVREQGSWSGSLRGLMDCTRGASTAAFNASADEEAESKMTPQAVVDRLNANIIGQEEAKKAVAVAYRNRWRRKSVRPELREDIVPKNILMVGPTGVGE